MTRRSRIPELCLVVLVGVSGSGKSTFAARALRPFEVLSSDFCRGLVADDENDQAATKDAFDVLHFIAGKRLAAGRLTVVDATNVQPRRARAARRAGPGARRAAGRDRARPARAGLRRAQRRPARPRLRRRTWSRRQRDQLRRSLRGLRARRASARSTCCDSVEEVEAATDRPRAAAQRLPRPARAVRRRSATCTAAASELETLLDELGYALVRDDARPRRSTPRHPDGRRAVFVGDLVDRGPDTPGRAAAGDGHGRQPATRSACPATTRTSWCARCGGRNVQVTHGLAETLAQLAAETDGVPHARSRRSATAWSPTSCSTTAGSSSRTPG